MCFFLIQLRQSPDQRGIKTHTHKQTYSATMSSTIDIMNNVLPNEGGTIRPTTIRNHCQRLRALYKQSGSTADINSAEWITDHEQMLLLCHSSRRMDPGQPAKPICEATALKNIESVRCLARHLLNIEPDDALSDALAAYDEVYIQTNERIKVARKRKAEDPDAQQRHRRDQRRPKETAGRVRPCHRPGGGPRARFPHHEAAELRSPRRRHR